jgi:hypothetical protein
MTGPLRYTMAAREAVKFLRWCSRLQLFPIHYQGWSQSRRARTQYCGYTAIHSIDSALSEA